MSKLVVIYWTGTGNTGAMAQAVADGAKSAGAEAELLTVSEISADAAAAALAEGRLTFDPDAVCAHHEGHGEGHDCGSHGHDCGSAEHTCGGHCGG